MEVVAGFLLALGERPTVEPVVGLLTPSEFGLYPDVFYLQMKSYF